MGERYMKARAWFARHGRAVLGVFLLMLVLVVFGAWCSGDDTGDAPPRGAQAVTSADSGGGGA